MATLGMPGDLVSRIDETSVSNWRVGGHPKLPDDNLSLPDALLCCKVCKEKLALVVQVSTPKGSDQPRGFLVFGCTRRGCGKEEESWRAVSFPLQKHPSESKRQTPDSTKEQASGKIYVGLEEPKWSQDAAGSSAAATSGATAVQPDAASAWTSGALEWQVDDEGFGQHDSQSQWGSSNTETDYSDLAEQLAKAGISATQREDQKVVTSPLQPEHLAAGKDSCDQAVQTDSRCMSDDAPALPEFIMWHLEESDDQQPGVSAAQQSHIADLLQKYEQECKVNQETPITNQEESWGGETYETVLPKGVSTEFMRFKKALDRYPQQCIRQGDSPLWPTAKASAQNLLKCRRCSSPLSFALQLMSPLLSMIDEAAEWLGFDEDSRAALHDWQWLSVLVFTCNRPLCRSTAALQEDQLVIVNEP